MERSKRLRALVLGLRDSGATQREATFLSDEEGLMRATVWGGAKSSLRSLVAPWHLGTLYLYHNPVRNASKVSDFDVVNQFAGIRENLDRSWAANAISEVILSSPGAAANQNDAAAPHTEALALAIDTLEALDVANEAACKPLFLRWLWRWLDLMGLAPDPRRCADCACELSADAVVWYLSREGVILCEVCRDRIRNEGFSAPGLSSALSPALRRWLSGPCMRPALPLARASLDRSLLAEAGLLVPALAREAMGRELSVWNSWP